MATHTTVWGEWLAKIAQDYGTTVGAIWNAPENAEHRARRGSPDVLYPGDVLFIPGTSTEPPPTPPPVPELYVPYIVRQGDYLDKLALLFRFDAEEVWRHPLNALLASRRDPNLLFPGDVLFIPDVPAGPSPITAFTTNVFSADLPLTTVSLRFLRGKAARANEGVTFNGLPPESEPPKATDSEGRVTLHVPLLLPAFELFFDDEPEVIYSVLVGHLNPIEEAAGVAQRLIALGYFPFDEEDPASQTEDIFTSFPVLFNELLDSYRKAHGLSDDATTLTEKLRDEFGA